MSNNLNDENNHSFSLLFSIPTEIIYPPYCSTKISTFSQINPETETNSEYDDDEEEYIRLPEYFSTVIKNK